MVKKTFLFGLFIIGAVSLYSCGDRQRDREQRDNEPMDQVPLPSEEFDQDTIPVDSLPPRPGAPITP